LIRRSPIKRRTRPRAVRKTKRGTQKRRCDALWSQIIRASNGGRCKLQGKDHVRCGGVLQAAHCFGRGHHSVRHELWCGIPLCAGHHVFYTHHPEAWNALLRQLWGNEEYERRYLLAQAIGRPDYEAIEAELKEALSALA
jgi:hypothetical protein